MTLRELIDALTSLVEGGEATGEEQVLFAHQPHYPLQCGVGGPVVLSQDDEDIADLESHMELPIGEYFDDAAEKIDAMARLQRMKRDRRPVVYLHEIGLPDREMSPYAPRSAWGD